MSEMLIINNTNSHFSHDSNISYSTYSTGGEWKVKHEIKQWRSELHVHFVSSDHLAICKMQSVKVHKVTTEEIHLLYTLTSHEWRGDVWPHSVAVSESMPDSILVICLNKPYVYQFPCQEASEYVRKYQIHDGRVMPRCIAANANTAVIGLLLSNELVVCSLPQFTKQKIVHLSIEPLDLCITASNILVMWWNEIVIKPLGSMDQDLCRIKPPQGCEFYAVSCRNDARQLYAACYHYGDEKGGVYKYVWEGHGTPQYVNTGCVIDNLGEVWLSGLSVTSDGLLAVSGYHKPLKIFSLEY